MKSIRSITKAWDKDETRCNAMEEARQWVEKNELGVCLVESQDDGGTGLPVDPMTKPANSEPEHVCRETGQTPNEI